MKAWLWPNLHFSKFLYRLLYSIKINQHEFGGLDNYNEITVAAGALPFYTTRLSPVAYR